MHTHVLAEQLTELAEFGAGGDSLVVEAQTGRMLFRFGCESGELGSLLVWEASPPDSDEDGPLTESQLGWLERAGFEPMDDTMIRRAAMPSTIGAARLIADLSAFLLEKALGLSADAPVWISRRTADGHRPRLLSA